VQAGSDILGESLALAQVIRDRPDMMGQAAYRAAENLGFFDTVETLIERAQGAGALRPDFRLEDIPLVMCSLGSLQTTTGEYRSWRRLRAIILDGLRAPGSKPLPDEPSPKISASRRRAG
jgi:hypothetical protein